MEIYTIPRRYLLLKGTVWPNIIYPTFSFTSNVVGHPRRVYRAAFQNLFHFQGGQSSIAFTIFSSTMKRDEDLQSTYVTCLCQNAVS